jgi:hypothetical protein
MGAATFSIMTLSIKPLCIMGLTVTLSMTSLGNPVYLYWMLICRVLLWWLSIMLSVVMVMIVNAECHYGDDRLCWVSLLRMLFMLSVTMILNVLVPIPLCWMSICWVLFILTVIMLSVVYALCHYAMLLMLSVIMLSVFILRCHYAGCLNA